MAANEQPWVRAMIHDTNAAQPIRLYTDGACIGNPGPGGWAYVLPDTMPIIEAFGQELQTTNNRMEIVAAIQGLEATSVETPVVVTTDSEYVRNGITQWLPNWIARNWRTSDRKPVKNQDLWQRLVAITQTRTVTWRWVRGHTPEDLGGDRWNHRADALANAQALDAVDKAQAQGLSFKVFCMVDMPSGKPCLTPATIVDRQRGMMVCARHAPGGERR